MSSRPEGSAADPQRARGRMPIRGRVRNLGRGDQHTNVAHRNPQRNPKVSGRPVYLAARPISTELLPHASPSTWRLRHTTNLSRDN